MCGIVGAMSSWLSVDEINRFKELMLVSNLRGKDGSGVIFINDSNEVDYVKSLGNGIDVCETDDFKNMTSNVKKRPSILIGHTRWPTKGAVDFDNTHPHDVGNIIGVHNGTMDRIMGKWVGNGESDSNLLYHAIQEHGIDEALKQSHGAYALVWVDIDQSTLNIIRNNKRPLYYATMTGGGTVYWASEYGMLNFILSRHSGKFEIKSVPEDTLITFKLGQLSQKSIRTIKGGEVPVYKAPFQTIDGVTTATTKNTGSNGYTVIANGKPVTLSQGVDNSNVVPFKADAPVNASEKQKTKELLKSIEGEVQEFLARERAAKRSEEEQHSFGHNDTYVETMKGHWVHKRIFNKLIDQGCAWCGTIPNMEDTFKVQFFANHEYVCQECVQDEFVQEYLSLPKTA